MTDVGAVLLRRPRQPATRLGIATLLCLALAAAASLSCGSPSSPAEGPAARDRSVSSGQGDPASAPAPSHPQQVDETPERLGLEPGKETFALTREGALRFRLTLPADHFVHLLVDTPAAKEEGADLKVSLTGPGSEIFVDSLATARVPEDVVWISDEELDYLLTVKAGRSDPPTQVVVRVEALRRATPEDRRWAKAEERLAEAHRLRRLWQEATCREAIPLYEEAAELFGGLERQTRQAEAAHALALLYNECLDDPAAATAAYARAVRLAPDLRSRARLLDLRGDLLIQEEQLDEARRCYEETARIGHGLSDRKIEALARSRLAFISGRSGFLGLAREDYTAALALWEEVGNVQEEAAILLNRGLLLEELGETTQAIEDLERALAALRQPGQPELLAVTLTALGGRLLASRASQGDLDRARTLLEEALALRQQAGDRRGLAVTLNALGRVHRRLDEPQVAQALYRRSLDIFREIEDRFEEATTLHNLGWLELHAGELKAAREHLANALMLYDGLRPPAAAPDTRLGLAKAERRLGLLHAARETERRALAEVERRRLEVGGPTVRTAFFASQQEHYDFYVDLLYEIYHLGSDDRLLAEAFEISERAKARALFDMMTAAGAHRGAETTPEATRIADLEQRIAATRRSLATIDSDGTGSDPEPLRSELRRLTRERADALKSAPAYAALLEEPLTLAQAQTEVLDDSTALLEYKLGDTHSLLFVVSRDSLRAFDLGPRQAIEERAQTVSQLLSDVRGRRANVRRLSRELEALSAAILPPSIGLEDLTRLAFVPDGALHAIPFGLLPRPATNSPLVADHETVILPSAATVRALRRRRSAIERHSGGGVLAVADPVYDVCDERLPAAWLRKLDACRPRAGRLPRPDYSRLAYSRLEAETLLGLAEQRKPHLRLFDFEANRGRLLSIDLSQFSILHLATHAVVDRSDAAGASLLLSRFGPGGRPLPGRLDISDIYGFELAAELVVLSACRSAAGREIRGEGLINLAHGFLQAGADRVVTTLWPIDDRSTADFMKAFYREIFVEKQSVSEGFRHAQRLFLRTQGDYDPYLWANFVLYGEWQADEGSLGGRIRRH